MPRLILGVFASSLWACTAWAGVTATDTDSLMQTLQSCLRPVIRAEVWTHEAQPEEAVDVAVSTCLEEYAAVFESMPIPVEQAAYDKHIDELRNGMVAFAEEMTAVGPLEFDLFGSGGLKRRPPTPAPEPEAAASTLAVQPSQEAQASVAAPDATPGVPAKEVQNDTHSTSFDYKGILIGGQATPELVTEKLGISCGVGFGNAQVCDGFSTIAGASASMNLLISGDGKVLRMLLTFPSNDFDAVEAAMLSKYGKPSMAANSSVQNGYGAQFQQRNVYWKNGSNFLSLLRYAGRIGEGMAYYSAEGDPMRQSRSQPDDL